VYATDGIVKKIIWL